MTAVVSPAATPAPAAPARDRSGTRLRTIARLTGLELRLLLREPMVAVSLIGFPVVTVLVLAGVFGDTPDPDFGGVRPSDHYLAGYLGVVLAALGLITIPVRVATYRELGVTRRFRASGISGPVLLAGEIVLGAVLGVIAAVVVLVVGAATYGLAAPEDPLGALAWFAVGLVCFIVIGVSLGTLLPNGRAANAVGNLLFVPAFLLGGGGPPRAVMTGPMETISDAVPLSHVIGGIRQAWLGTTDDPHALWWPVAVAAIALAAALVRSHRRP